MLILLERECLEQREEIEHFTEKQEVLASVMEGKMSMQQVAPEKYQEKIFEELKELEEQKTREALELVQRKQKLVKWEGEREREQGCCKGWSRQGLQDIVVRSLRQFSLWFVLILPGTGQR